MIPELQWPNQLPPLMVNSRASTRSGSSSSASTGSGTVPATAPGSNVGSGKGSSSSSSSTGSDQLATGAAPPAPAPGPERPGVKILDKGTVGHTNPVTGCVDVAESIHCPPKHPIEPSLVEEFDLPVGVGFGG